MELCFCWSPAVHAVQGRFQRGRQWGQQLLAAAPGFALLSQKKKLCKWGMA